MLVTRSEPIVIKNSPTSFVISGPRGVHREVLVRSAHNNLDLINYDPDKILGATDTISLRDFLQPESQSVLRTYAVRSLSIAPVEGRSTYLTFVWKGYASTSRIERIGEMFAKATPDIMSAIDDRAYGALEWHLSGLVRACEQASAARLARNSRFRNVVYVSLAMYAAIFAGVAGWYFAEELTTIRFQEQFMNK